jgi:hypothetical protein
MINLGEALKDGAMISLLEENCIKTIDILKKFPTESETDISQENLSNDIALLEKINKKYGGTKYLTNVVNSIKSYAIERLLETTYSEIFK